MKAQDLIPKYWDLPVSAEKDVIFLGRVTVERIVSSWRSNLKSHDGRVKEVEERLHLLQDHDVLSLREIASRFENPADIVTGRNENGWGGGGEREPVDRASLERNSDATTLNICGWCKHTSVGLCRYNFNIKTRCSFEEDAGTGDYGDRVFDSPCFIQTSDDKWLNELRYGIEGKLELLRLERREIAKKLRVTTDLLRKTEVKPALSSHRPHDWFNIDDPVVCFVGGWPKDADVAFLADVEWATAKVIDGYRHHDGCVSVHYDERAHGGDYLDGHGGGYGMGRPEIMHRWELEYLLANPTFALLYATLGTGRHISGFNPEVFLRSLNSLTKS